MGYYCTVPQCTSLAGKTKNVKFHRFPRDVMMADKWNVILKRGKPYTKYSKVCSLHFTQADYNVTTMGQWKTLSKDAIPSRNLPKLRPDGSVMVIRKSRTVKYKEGKKDEFVRAYALNNKTQMAMPSHTDLPLTSTDAVNHQTDPQDSRIPTYPVPTTVQNSGPKPKKQDAIMQTDPLSEEEDTQPNQSYSETSDTSYPENVKGYSGFQKEADYNKKDDYIPQTNEEYNKEAERYALERKSHNGYEKVDPLHCITDMYYEKQAYPRTDYMYANGYQDSVELLRNQQQNLQMLQDPHRVTENQTFFHDNQIKQEVDLKEDDKFIYDRTKEGSEQNPMYPDQRLMDHHSVKQEPGVSNGCENVMQPQVSPYYSTNVHTDYYNTVPRPGPELLIAKQNALAANMQLWQNMKRPFSYDISPYNSAQLFHKEDVQRILQ